MQLNLGCSDRHLPAPWINVDIAPPADVIADLTQEWPWPESSVDEVFAADVFEHLYDRVFTMNELHRVMKPGARATIEVPNAAKGAGQWQDPTHLVGYCLNSFQYFRAGSFAHKRLAKAYGITATFNVLSLSEREYRDEYEPVWKITAVLEAVK